MIHSRTASRPALKSSHAAGDIHAELPDEPSYTTVRGLLRVLEEKGHLRHAQEEKRYVYVACTPRAAAGASYLRHVVRTFFSSSPTAAMGALLGPHADRISESELDRLSALIEKARVEKRNSGSHI